MPSVMLRVHTRRLARRRNIEGRKLTLEARRLPFFVFFFFSIYRISVHDSRGITSTPHDTPSVLILLLYQSADCFEQLFAVLIDMQPTSLQVRFGAVKCRTLPPTKQNEGFVYLWGPWNTQGSLARELSKRTSSAQKYKY